MQHATPTSPSTIIDSKGKIVYTEKSRPNEQTMIQYVDNVLKDVLLAILTADESAEAHNKSAGIDLGAVVRHRLGQKDRSDVVAIKEIELPYIPENMSGWNSDATVTGTNSPQSIGASEPPICLKTRRNRDWNFDAQSTMKYLAALRRITTVGTTFEGKYALITGAGPGSIGSYVLQGLLQGGAHVIITTSRASPKAFHKFQDIYVKYGGRGSQLRVVPFNQGSKQDVEALVDYIYADDGLGWDLDFIIPFAAVPERGNDITDIDPKSEFAHRLMLTNLLRILGSVMKHKKTRGYDTNPAEVLLPLSPNHGTFGKDGIYSESKLALETTFNKGESESWGDYLSICGAVIGWTRGTGLMNVNNQIAEAIEKEGVRTFSAVEMGFHILGLLHPKIRRICAETPLLADLDGGLSALPTLADRII